MASNLGRPLSRLLGPGKGNDLFALSWPPFGCLFGGHRSTCYNLPHLRPPTCAPTNQIKMGARSPWQRWELEVIIIHQCYANRSRAIERRKLACPFAAAQGRRSAGCLDPRETNKWERIMESSGKAPAEVSALGLRETISRLLVGAANESVGGSSTGELIKARSPLARSERPIESSRASH